MTFALSVTSLYIDTDDLSELLYYLLQLETLISESKVVVIILCGFVSAALNVAVIQQLGGGGSKFLELS